MSITLSIRFTLLRFIFIYLKTIHTLLTTLILFAVVHCGVGQVCSNCSATTTNIQPAGITSNIPTTVNTNAAMANTRWVSGIRPTTNGIARFQNPGFYRWEAGAGPATVRIGGLILEEGVNLTLDKQSTNEVEAFDIVGGCIVVKNNAVLDFRYFSALESVDICVEAGGKVIFDSRSTNGQRNDFSFDDVVINLQGPTATLDFGDADLKILSEDGLAITGWTGDQVCFNNVSPPSGASGNISWTNGTVNICELLNFGVLPVEWLYLNADFNDKERFGIIKWATAKEWGNSQFEIQRSLHGIQNWEAIGTEPGYGWSDNPVEYLYKDNNLPSLGGMAYYRLKQVDFDGKYAFSKVVSVRIPSVQGFKQNWRVYPNPVSGEEMTIEYLAPNKTAETEITAKLIHSSGLLIGYQIGFAKEVSDWLTEKIHNSNPGLYLLEIGLGRNMEFIKIVKR